MLQATLSVKSLRDAMAKVGRAVERRTTIPILGMIRLTVTDGKLTVCGTDLDMMASISIPVMEAKAGSICVPRTIVRLLASLPNFETIRLSEVEGRRLVIDLPDGRVSLIGVDPEDFPTLNLEGQIRVIELPAADLLGIFSKLYPFISHEETRYYLNGVSLRAVDKKLIFAATNGRQLGKIAIDAPHGSDTPPTVIIPHGAVSFLMKSFPKGENALVTITNLRAMFRTKENSFALVTNLIDGTFPDYERVIPKEFVQEFDIPASAWIGKLARATAFRGGPHGHGVTISRDDMSRTTISARNPDAGEMVVAIQAKEVSGPRSFTFGANSALLSGVLAAHAGNEIRMKLVNSGSPMVFDNGDVTTVLMPMRIGDKALPLPEGCEP